jgi:hypothetical protein
LFTYAQTRNPTVGWAGVNALLQYIQGVFYGQWTIHLFTAGPSPIGPIQQPSDFTEVNWGGYNPVLFEPTGVSVNSPSGSSLLLTQNVLFKTNNANPPPRTVLGYWVDDAFNNVLLAEYFPEPALIVKTGDAISLLLAYPITFFPSAV